MASVNKSSLIKQLADAYPGFIRLDITRLVNIILYEIENALKRNESVEIRGKFSIKPRNQKAGFRRNPRTGEKLFIKKKEIYYLKCQKSGLRK